MVVETKSCRCNHSNQRKIFLAVRRSDPTRTKTLRDRFSADMNRRYKAIISDLKESIITNDVFGLSEPGNTPFTLAPIPSGAFRFDRDPQKVVGFMRWLRQQADDGILQVINRGAGGQIDRHRPFMNLYIDSAYKRGINRAIQEANKQGVSIPTPDVPETADKGLAIEAMFNRPINAERAEMIYTRAYETLQGNVGTMANKVSQTLAQALIDGKSALQIASALAADIEISRKRALTLARTEIVRAHNMGLIQTCRDAGFEGVKVMAEWSTAGWNVCPDCASLDGQILTLKEAEEAIPLHPNCRCTAIPNFTGEEKNLTGKQRRDQVGWQYTDKKGRFTRKGLFEEKTGRPDNKHWLPHKRLVKPGTRPKNPKTVLQGGDDHA